jgi:hypothetical protein
MYPIKIIQHIEFCSFNLKKHKILYYLKKHKIQIILKFHYNWLHKSPYLHCVALNSISVSIKSTFYLGTLT